MAELQFLVDTSAVNTIKNLTIGANFEELSSALMKLNDEYKSVLYTDAEIPLAKKELAKLRSLQKHINEYKIFVTKQAGEPIERFKDQCKQTISILDNAISNIDRQIKQSEEKRKQEKYFLLEQYFNNVEKKYPEYHSLEYCLPEKWENKSYDIEQCYRDIDLACFNIDHDVQSIIDLHSDFEVALLDNYKKSHLLYETLQMNDRLMADKKRKEEEQKRLEEQYKQKRAEEEARAAAAKVIEKTNPTPKEEEPEQMYIATFKVYGSYEQLTILRHFMNNNGLAHSFEGMTKTDKPAEAVLG